MFGSLQRFKFLDPLNIQHVVLRRKVLATARLIARRRPFAVDEQSFGGRGPDGPVAPRAANYITITGPAGAPLSTSRERLDEPL
jgi:hypothetical protein